MIDYRVSSPFAIALALASWALATGFSLERVWQDGVASYTLVAAMPILTLSVAILLHQGFSDWRNLRPIRGSLGVALGLLCLAVTLPASIGTSGAARDNAISRAEASNRSTTLIRDDLDNVSRTLKWAEADMIGECGSGNGPRCGGKRSTVQALVDRKAHLTAELQAAPPAKTALSGENRIAWLLGLAGAKVTEAEVTMLWPILPPIAFELLCAYFLFLGLGTRSVTKVTASVTPDDVQALVIAQPAPVSVSETVSPPPAKKKPVTKRAKRKAKVQDWVREYTIKNGTPPPFKLVRNRFHLTDGSASRWRRQAMAA